MESMLRISKIGFPVWSLRNCQQRLYPVKTAALRRTVNGTLISLVPETHQKYATLIECQDRHSPAMEHLWVGDAVLVHCIQPLTQEFSTKTIGLSRLAVMNSIEVYDEHSHPVSFSSEQGRIVSPETHKGYVRYRPVLEMRLKSFHMQNHEWALKTSWALELEEI